jgi:ABC-type nickel/cobalt efflux system permease component RcnA
MDRSARTIPATVGVLLMLVAMHAGAGSVAAHPLGNFTINHYTGVRIAPGTIVVDHVLDMAEIPAFQERAAIDEDRDGSLSPSESAAYREAACARQGSQLRVELDGVATPLAETGASLTFPPGAGGLVTLRLVCRYEGPVAIAAGATHRLLVAEGSYPERLGWREIVLEADRVSVTGHDLRSQSISARLTAYPPERLAAPLAEMEVRGVVTLGGPGLPPLAIPELGGDGSQPAQAARPAIASELNGGLGAAIDEGLDGPGLFLLAVLVAAALGAGHALTPGHGKALIGAYLVGTRGTYLDAAWLGLTVALAHTLGVLVLAGIVALAGTLLPAERVYPWLSLASGLLVLALGTALFGARVREFRTRTQGASAVQRGAHDHDHVHGNAHGHPSGHRGEPEHHQANRGHERFGADPHGRRARPTGLIALGLSGGLVPSASALILLLGSVALGRPLYGLVLVIAFGLGMAIVLAGIGLAIAGLGERVTTLAGGRPRRLPRLLPIGSAAIVLVIGIVLSSQALLALT